MTTEKQINQMLVQGLEVYMAFKKQGKDELAQAALDTTSAVANLALDVSGIRKSYRKVYCYSCQKQLTTGFDIDFTRHTGRCLSCDHLEVNP